jgi:hypothetical protein
MSVDLPTEYGGSGQSFFASILVIEALSRIDPSVGLLADLQNTLLNRLFLVYGTEQQKQRYLPRMATNLVCAFVAVFMSRTTDSCADDVVCCRSAVSVYRSRARAVTRSP